MRILFLSFYYPPDIGPGPLRAKSLVDALMEVDSESLSIDVFTTMPNRYQSHTIHADSIEEIDSVSIMRVSLPAHKSGMADQARAYFTYARAVKCYVKGKRWDVIIATSSRLMTALLGAWVAKRSKAMLYLDLRDIFSETIDEVFNKSLLRFLLPLLRYLEVWSIRSADKVNVVSSAFVNHINIIDPTVPVSVFTNGIDAEFIDEEFYSLRDNNPLVILYAGNIGDGQGLHRVVPQVAEELIHKVAFKLIGDGGKRKKLEDLVKARSLNNIQVFDPMPRQCLYKHYHSADVLFLHLNDYRAFRKVLPSKIFEYAATGKPILAGVNGYAAQFLREEVPGVEVFEPCDSVAMKKALLRLLDGPRLIDRTEFCKRYLRKSIMAKMAVDILSLARKNS